MNRQIYEQRRQAFQKFHYLPLFYLIPYEIAQKRKLEDFPRDPYIAVTDEKWRAVYGSKPFQVKLMDTWGWMMWQCLGIKGGIDNYSHNDPFVRITFDLGMWAWLLVEIGITTDVLAAYPPEAEIPFLTLEQATQNCEQFAKYFWNHPFLKMREVWEIVKTHRDHRDYSSMPSHVKMDFRRKYYHTRAKTKFEPIIGEDDEVIYAPYTPNEFDDVETRIWFEDFLKRLNERDRKIVQLLAEEYTREEIAGILGYANHSGVNKRIKHIQRELTKFRNE
jgi:hypothetical protein